MNVPVSDAFGRAVKGGKCICWVQQAACLEQKLDAALDYIADHG